MASELALSTCPQQQESRSQRTYTRWLWLVFACVLWLKFLRFPVEDTAPDLDFSWKLSLASFFKQRAHAGVDYVWTYGPLGYFTTDTYDSDLFWLKYVWEMIFAAVLAGLFTRLGAMLPSRSLRVGYIITIFCLLSVQPDTLYPAAMALAVLLTLRAEHRPRSRGGGRRFTGDYRAVQIHFSRVGRGGLARPGRGLLA